MISPARFTKLQRLFFDKVTKCCNPAKVTISYIAVTHGDSYEAFTGDGEREPDKVMVLRCFYMRNLSDKQREDIGVSQEVTDVVYISPLELKQKSGDDKFPEYVTNSFSQISIEFLGKHYELLNIVDLEPMHNGNSYTCLAYQLNLSFNTGNKSHE